MWRKSSYSPDNGGNCVEVAWRKSSHSPNNGGNCVEVGAKASAVLLRDSKDVTGPILTLSARNWAGFLRSL